MPVIDVKPAAPEIFQVTIGEGERLHEHHFLLPHKVWQRMGFGAPAAVVVETALRIILEREPLEHLSNRLELAELAEQHPYLKQELEKRLSPKPTETQWRPGPPEVA